MGFSARIYAEKAPVHPAGRSANSPGTQDQNVDQNTPTKQDEMAKRETTGTTNIGQTITQNPDHQPAGSTVT